MYDHHTKAGNPGDVIKHVALVAAANVLMQTSDGIFHYADTFAGYAFNPIMTIGEWQCGIGAMSLSDKKSDNSDVRFWQSLWQCEVGLPGSIYPGSSTFIRKLCLKNDCQFKASLWDVSATVISQLMQVYGQDEAEIFPRSARLDDFLTIKPNLLLIDPPDFAAINNFLAFFNVSPNVILWLPILANCGVETEQSKQAYSACQKKGFKAISVHWQGTEKMCGCRLVFQLTPPAEETLTSAVLNTTSLMGWTAI